MLDKSSLAVTRLASALGAEVRGVVLKGLQAEDVALIKELLWQHKVLFFPGQNLSIEEHVAFGEAFGELQGHPHKENPITRHDKIFELAASHGGIADEWHSDITFRKNPALISILNMIKCPAVGGDTLWTNPELAFAELSAPLRALCEGMSALHNAAPHGRPEVMTIHPLVRIHPVTGRKSLFVNEHFTRRIVELSHEESDHWLTYLTRWIASPRFNVRYKWAEGTIAMWDNRCTQHRVMNDFNEERVIQRVTVMGDVVDGTPPQWEPFVKPGHASDTSRYDQMLADYLSQEDAR
jgi:taurine dioxygenase